MNILMEKADSIINYINGEMEELGISERAMVLLYVCKLCKSVVDLDVVDAIDNTDERDMYNELDVSVPLSLTDSGKEQ